jgi:hypothetical protein
MKIYFGFVNADDITKLSPALQARGINMLKAPPCNVPLRGLYQVEQPGYIQYSAHLPAFLYANDTNKRTPVTREGYPVMISAENIIPLAIPLISVSFKNRGIPESISNFTGFKEVTSKNKNQHTFLVNYKPGLYGRLRNSGFEQNTFPLANSVSADDLPSLITILRILSSFLRVHKYPAFDDMDDLLYDIELRHETSKRPLTTAESDTLDFEINKKQVIGLEEDGERHWIAVESIMDELNAKIHYAKPVKDDKAPWGATDNIPHTDGIVFPFISDLAAWDKETVCSTIGHYFMRCLGHTTDGCLAAFSDLSAAWKRSLHRTALGDELSHIFRVVELAIPAQARVYPVFEGGRYTGCYLSGAGYSIALRRELLRPTSYANNKGDFDSFEGTNMIVKKIVMLFGEKPDENYQKAVKFGALKSMRGLSRYLATWVVTPTRWVAIRTLAARLSYPQEYLRINMDNIQLVLGWMVGEKEIPIDTPMHSSGLGQTSTIALALSAFGPSAPSPTVPGAPKLALTPKVPPKFNRTLVFRTTTLENAISDWNEVASKGFTYNGPEQLSARYQFVTIKGEVERDRWFSVMHQYHTWYSASQQGKENKVVEHIDVDDAGGVSIGKDGVNFDGF